MKKNLLIYLIGLTLILLPIVGYIKCVVKLLDCDFEPSYKAEVIYGIGTVTGLGVIIGFMDFGK